MTEQKFPTEFIELPSKGHFYAEENPLSTGKVEMKYMTAKEEDILTSVNLIQQGIVIDKVLDELIVDKEIKQEELLLGDKNALLIGARVLAYGKNYEFSYTDVYDETINGKVDLTKLKEKKIDFSKIEKGQSLFSFELPKTKRKLTFYLSTVKSEKDIQVEIDAINKVYKDSAIDRAKSTRLKHIIKSVDGKVDRQYINNFVDNEFLSVDALALRGYMKEITPDIVMDTTIKNSQGGEENVTVPITVEFFWPGIEV
jgi:hypothetical protein